MLVLSRRETEKVLFPTLGISVEVLRIRGNTTKLGIDAPADIPVLRHEIASRPTTDLTPDEKRNKERLADLAHAVRRRLDNAATTLNALHQELDENGSELAQRTVLQLYGDLQALEREANDALDESLTKSLRVLVVDDSMAEQKLLAGALEMSGLNVTTANDGQDALDFLSMHSPPDAVLLDMFMPRCDGPGFVQQVRTNPELQGLKIFAVSGVEPSTLGLTTGPDGIDGWFPKPLDPRELVSTLTARLNDLAAA